MSVMTPPAPSPNRLPVLTEVVSVPGPNAHNANFNSNFNAEPDISSGGFLHDPMQFATTQPQSLTPPQHLPDEDAVVQRVLFDLHRQIDLMFEQRLRESLSPALARITDMLVREVRGELGATLREMVERAVALELSRHRRG